MTTPQKKKGRPRTKPESSEPKKAVGRPRKHPEKTVAKGRRGRRRNDRVRFTIAVDETIVSMDEIEKTKLMYQAVAGKELLAIDWYTKLVKDGLELAKKETDAAFAKMKK